MLPKIPYSLSMWIFIKATDLILLIFCYCFLRCHFSTMSLSRKPTVRGNVRGYRFCAVQGGFCDKGNRVIPPDMISRLKIHKHPSQSLTIWCGRCRRTASGIYPLQERETARGVLFREIYATRELSEKSLVKLLKRYRRA